MALGAAERQTAELFEPEGRVFGCSGTSLAPQSRTLSEGTPRCSCHLLENKIATPLSVGTARPEGPLAMTHDMLDSRRMFTPRMRGGNDEGKKKERADLTLLSGYQQNNDLASIQPKLSEHKSCRNSK